jgi:hypothetical protein
VIPCSGQARAMDDDFIFPLSAKWRSLLTAVTTTRKLHLDLDVATACLLLSARNKARQATQPCLALHAAMGRPCHGRAHHAARLVSALAHLSGSADDVSSPKLPCCLLPSRRCLSFEPLASNAFARDTVGRSRSAAPFLSFAASRARESSAQSLALAEMSSLSRDTPVGRESVLRDCLFALPPATIARWPP